MVTSPPLLLGLDVGSSRVKALLLDRGGGERRVAAVASSFARTDDGVEATVEELLGAVRRAVAELGDDRRRVEAVGIAGLAESGAPLDGADRPLAPVIAWHDRRGEDVAERLQAQFGADLARRIGQPVRYVSSVAKLGWLLDHGVTDVRRWLGVPELCGWALTGSAATEWSLAARTGCFDIGRRAWLPEVAQAAGFDIKVFPEVFGAGAEIGRVTGAAADEWGLPADIPVTIAGHDHLSGVIGSGARVDDFVNSVGTAETVVGLAPSLPAAHAGVAVTLFPGGDGWAVLASGARAGLAVEDAARVLGASPAELDALAAEGSETLDASKLLNSLHERKPPALPEGPPGVVWRTLLDALSVCTAEAVEQVAALLGPPRRLVVFGGGARSQPWLAAKAVRLDVPVWRTEAGEAVARGAAIVAGIAAGWWASVIGAPQPRLAQAPG